MERVSYGCVALLGTNKVGKLTPDSDGYYELVLGGLDTYNSGGAFYPLNSAKSLFEQSSNLMRRIETGACRGEYGHPKQLPNQDMRSFLRRVSTIYEDNVCCHFKDVRLEHNAIKDSKGNRVVAVIGHVKPSGPKGQALAESLENPNESVCFSVRSLTDDKIEGGRLVKHIRTIVTWDYVNEPGIDIARKWNAPGLESFQETEFTRDHVEGLDTGVGAGMSMESSGGVSGSTIFVDFGWKKTGSAGLVLPPSARW
ncbi:hypothetical protein D3C81_226420 [compost metagenome]